MNSKDIRTLKIACFGFICAICIAYLLIMPWGIDMEFHMLRIGELAKEISRGCGFPIYIFRDVYNHYGYPIPIFYGELIALPFALLNLAGLSINAAYRIMVISILLLAFVSSYCCIKSFCADEAVSLLGAFCYCMQPYFLCELFVRASVGSAFVFVFIPLIMLGIYHIDRNTERRKSVVCLGIGMAGIITSHVISAVLVFIALIVFFAVRFRAFVSRKDAISSVILSALLCMVLSAWFICPMLEQLVSSNFRSQNTGRLEIGGLSVLTLFFPMHLSVALSSLLKVHITESVIGGCSVYTILLCLYMILSKQPRKMERLEKGMYITYFVMFISLMVNAIWIPLGYVFGFMQFSWRIYIIMTMISAYLTLTAITADKDSGHMKKIYIIAALSASYVLIFYLGYFGIRDLVPDKVSGIIGHEITETGYSTETADVLYIPEEVDLDHIMGSERTVWSDPAAIRADFDIDEEKGSVVIDVFECTKDTVVECPFIMYKGYSAALGQSRDRFEVKAGDNGLVNVCISEGTTGKIVVSYTGTVMQKVSFVISLGSLVLLVIYGVFRKKKSSE